TKGLTKYNALQESLLLNIKAVFLTSLTTAIGFLMLNFAEVPILSHLGNLTAVGVILACILSLTVLPALLVLLPAPHSVSETGGEYKVRKLGNWVVSHHRRILPYSVLIVSVSLLFCMNNRLNDVAVEYFDLSSPFRQSVEIQKKYLGGMSNIDFAIYTDEPYGVNDPAVMKEVDALAKWLRSQPEVKHVLSFADIIKRLNMNMHDDESQYFKLPDTKELAAQYLLLYEMSLPYGLDLNNQIDIDKSAVRMIAVLENLGSNEFTEFEQRTKRWFDKLAPDLRLEAASPALMFAHIGARNMESMVWGSLAALVVISLLITLALRSWRLGLVSLMANLMPAGIGFGLWGMMSGEINMALSVELSMTMGIIVDDSVHFLLKYQAARKDNSSVKEAVQYAFETVGRAMITTTVVLAAGFGVLLFSDFRLNSDMGLMTNIIFIAALLIDLLFLPSFLIWLDKDKAKKVRYAP
ncbi:efflux RND transporter permease subunit, partial [Alteromonas sp. 14N.309.X.WAT.G.H12]|uniref:efflux RND transporter permease subunit n=1 Tax=Alteromonas sp. 14N.309.X.WAT.G.H12 TaxID=3120824 RepID=UPI002FD69393